MIREFAEGNGARFLVGIQYRDDALAGYLAAKGIPFAKLEGAPHYAAGWGPHWTPAGHGVVADRIFSLLSAHHLVGNDVAAQNRLRLT